MLSFLMAQITASTERRLDPRTRALLRMGATAITVGGAIYAVYRCWNRPRLEPALLAQPHYDDIDSLSKKIAGLSLTPESPPSWIAQEYQKTIQPMSEMIISGAQTYPQPKSPKIPVPAFANLEGYSKEHKPEWGKKTDALYVEYETKRYPIGYKIFMPDDISQVSDVIVCVYGGNKEADKKNLIDSINRSAFTKWGVAENCCVIELFLPDLLQPDSQFVMSVDLYSIIQRCIHHFFEKVREPQSLDPELVRYGFAKAHYFLMGASFGGAVVVRHSQLYPHTFNGYISHDGNLGPLKDMPIVPTKPRVYANASALSPLAHVKDCEDAMLLLQNNDDNNVNRENVLKFYEALKSHNKAHLAKLCFFNKGNAAEADELWNKGHFLPSDIQRYVKTIFDFIRDPCAIPVIDELIFTRKRLVAQQCFINDVKERFLAIVCHLFINNPLEQQTDYYHNWENYWSDICEPILWTMLQIKELVANKSRYQEKIEELIGKNQLSQKVIQNAVKQHAPMFQELYRELNHGAEISTQEIVDDPHILKTYTDLLLDHNTNDFVKNVILESLLMGNPSLMPTSISAQWKKLALEYKKEFKDRIDEYKAALQNASHELTAAPAILSAYKSSMTSSVRLIFGEMLKPEDYFYIQERPGH
ncbi:MAG: alpha/beta hydrolase family protein [Candidatus Berkiella sp.]